TDRLGATGGTPRVRPDRVRGKAGSALGASGTGTGARPPGRRNRAARSPGALGRHRDLDRFYPRLEDEFEIIERGTLLNGKVGVVASAAETFTDLIDNARSARLELVIAGRMLA